MPLPLIGAISGAKLIGRAKAIVTSPWFWAALLVVGLGAGTFFYLKTDKKEAVTTAVKAADQTATNKALETQALVTDRQAKVEQKFIILREQTIKDYSNARATLEAAPADERQAPAPRLLVDTLNNLDRLRAARDPAPVPVADIPVG